MNHCNTTHNGSLVFVQAHRLLSVGWRGKGGQGMLPQPVGGHVEPSASVNTFPPYYCLFTLDRELHGNFNR